MNLGHAAINVVVNCTARKTMQVPKQACLRSIKSGSLERRLDLWILRLQDASSIDSLAAEELYCGDAWAVARATVEAYGMETGASLWVASAGYGLIHATEQIHPYSATFMPGHEDSVSANHKKSECVAWWTGLCQWAKKSTKRSISSIELLAKRFPSTPLLIALSENYVAALVDDLDAARKHLRDPDLLVIVSAGSSKVGKLANHFLPCDARLEHRFGGARGSLNSRILRHILQTTKPEDVRCSLLRKRFRILLALQPKHRTFDRSKMTDAKVADFIARSLRTRPDASHSVLLRELRDSNRACEQKRFRQIFLSVKNTSIPSL